MKKFNQLYNKIKKECSQVYYIPGWHKSIREYSEQFIKGEDPKVQKKNEKKNSSRTEYNQ